MKRIIISLIVICPFLLMTDQTAYTDQQSDWMNLLNNVEQRSHNTPQTSNNVEQRSNNTPQTSNTSQQSDWTNLVNSVERRSNNTKSNYNSSQTTNTRSNYNSNQTIKRTKRPNPAYIRLKQQLNQINSQISQVEHAMDQQLARTSVNMGRHYPGIASGSLGSLMGLFDTAVNETAQSNQYTSQLSDLNQRKNEILELLEKTPPEIEHVSYHTPVSVRPPSPNYNQKKENKYMVIKETKIMSNPSHNSELLGTIPKQFIVKIHETQNGWVRIGKGKWIMEKYVLLLEQ